MQDPPAVDDGRKRRCLEAPVTLVQLQNIITKELDDLEDESQLQFFCLENNRSLKCTLCDHQFGLMDVVKHVQEERHRRKLSQLNIKKKPPPQTAATFPPHQGLGPGFPPAGKRSDHGSADAFVQRDPPEYSSVDSDTSSARNMPSMQCDGIDRELSPITSSSCEPVTSCSDKKVRKQIADLREEQRQFELISQLSERGAVVWRQLPDHRKFEKDILLAVLCSDTIPEELSARNWDSNAPVDLLKDDREILIARASATTFDDRREESPYFSIPEALLGDLDVVRAVAKFSPKALCHPDIPTKMFDNEELFQVLVDRQSVTVSNESYRKSLEGILGRFSERIRSSAEFMLKAAAMGLNVFPCIAGGLRHDKDFCLELAKVSSVKLERQIPDDALTHFSDALRDDFDVVCAFLMKSVHVLLHCSEHDRARLSRDKDLVTRICWRRRHCPLETFPDLYAMLDAQLKLDWDVVVAAQEGECFDVSDLPQELSNDPTFWKYALEKCSLFWKDLPDAFKREISFARCITGFYDGDLVKDVVAVHPELSSDAEYWRSAILSLTSTVLDYSDICELVNYLGIQNNRAVMLFVCSCTDEALPALPSDFALDREFLAAIVESNDYALNCIPYEAQQLYPDLVTLAISKYPASLKGCSGLVNPELWSNLDVAEAWFRNGGRIDPEIPARLKKDPDFCLLVVEHCEIHEADRFVWRRLKWSKDVTIRAIERKTIAYLLVCGGTEMDYDVALAGFGATNSDTLVDLILDLGIDTFPYLPSFFHEVQLKLRVHDSLLTLLCGMSSISGDGCSLLKLIRGQETSLVWKRRIADYMGCPIGVELAQLRRAALALQRILPPSPLGSD